jgi:hypothetical protein
MRTIRKELEESLWDSGEDYQMKTDEEIIEIISNFGSGECEFHTVDICRLVVENQRMKKILNIEEI